MKLTLKKSWQGFIFFMLLHVAAVTIIFFINLPGFYGSLLIVLCFFSLYDIVNYHVKRTAKKAVISFWQLANKDWCLLQQNGNVIPAQLLGRSVVTRLGAVLNFLPYNSKKIKTIIIFPDMLTSTDFRRLRVILFSGFI